MRLIETWIERHPVLSKIGRAVIIMGVLYGGTWACATWTVTVDSSKTWHCA